MPYATQILGQGQALANIPYQAYPGQRIAGFSEPQLQAFHNIQQMRPSGYLRQAGNLLGQANNLAGYAATNQFTGANVGQYMNPYIEDVVNRQTMGAIQDYGRQLPGMAGVATQVGGLGGSREALVNAEAQRNLQNNLGNIRAQGYAGAFNNAQNAFDTANQRMMQGAGLMGQSAAMYGNLGNQDFAQNAGINTALLGIGGTQQQQEQNVYNTSYGNFQDQLNYPWTQLGKESALLSGTPLSGGVSTNSASPGSTLGQVAGIGLGLGSLFGTFG
jgi:hypothetical protein